MTNVVITELSGGSIPPIRGVSTKSKRLVLCFNKDSKSLVSLIFQLIPFLAACL